MSGIALCFQRDGAPVSPQLLGAVADRLAHRALDGSSRHLRGVIGMAHARFAVTPDEVGDEQPLAGRTRPLRWLFDGRLDNRDELIHDLGLLLSEGAELSDAALALRAYEAWGDQGLERLIGPMAIALYDSWRGRVVLFRDRVGGRGLYYHLSPRWLIAATEPYAVLAARGVDDSLDEGRLASLFAVVEPAPGATFFEAVRELPPGHRLVVDQSGAQLEQWWHPGSQKRLRYGNDDAYAEHFLCLLDRAVHCRMRSVGGPAMLLSGGLDSAALAAVASRPQANPPLAVSWGFNALKEADERSWSDQLTRGLGLPRRVVLGDRCWPLAEPEAWPTNPNTPEANSYRRLHEASYQAARETGRRVVLTGLFGDQLFLGSEGWWWSLVRDRRLGTAYSEARRQTQAAGVMAFLRYAVVGPPLRRLGFRPPGRLRAPWLTAHGRDRLPPPERSFDWARRPIQAEAVLGLLAAQGGAHESWYAHRAAVEVRLPMRDARLVDFMLQLPAAQLHRASGRRPIVRRALAGRVPDRIRRRQDKTSLASLFRLGMAQEIATIVRLVASPHAAWPSFVDPAWLLRTPLAEASEWSEKRLYVLWLVLCVETWLERQQPSQEAASLHSYRESA